MSDVKTPPRKLVDLNPKWFGISKGAARGGVIFDCPCLDEKCAWGGQIAISFSNPLDGGVPEPVSIEKLWQRTGETFETLTLSPSIHCVGHWHGWLRNGVLESC